MGRNCFNTKVCVSLPRVRGDQIDALRPTSGQIADVAGYTHVHAIVAVEACKSGFEQTEVFPSRLDGDLFGCWSGASPDRCDSRPSRAGATHVCPRRGLASFGRPKSSV